MRELTAEQRDVVARIHARKTQTTQRTTKPAAKKPTRRRGKNRCSWCLELGHDARICPSAPPDRAKRHRDPLHRSDNAGYRQNRRRELCDDCGAKSERSRCPRCVARRKLAPSRRPAYVKAHRGDRTKEYAKRNAKRRRLA